tara:strand:+ start:1776 stop:2219 length:444 start_codon:yes stop_codon:yes gene_type:complete
MQKLERFVGDLANINQINYTGILTTVTSAELDFMPRLGNVPETKIPWANGMKFLLDGNKQANFLAVAYGEELTKKITELMENSFSEGRDRPWARIGITAKIQHNNRTDSNGKVIEYKNELVITDIWEAPVKAKEVFTYTTETGVEEE